MREAYLFALTVLCLGLLGTSCVPQPEAQVPEDRTPYFLEGRAKAERRDYRAAIEAFEKDVEQNPRSAQAHFELGVLFDQHGDRSESDLVSAMYHYQQVMRLRAPSVYPHDNARKRFMDCKMELVKMESLTPVYQQVVRDLERYREENALMRKQLEGLGVQPGPLKSGTGGQTTAPVLLDPIPGNQKAAVPSYRPPTNTVARVMPSTRTHIVQNRETAYAIARQYRISLTALQSANPTMNPRRLQAGQRLIIPAQ